MKRKKLLLNLLALISGISILLLSTSAIINYRAAELDGNGSGESNGVINAAKYWHMLRANQLTDEINPADVLQARKQVQANVADGNRGLGLSWTELGPDNFGGRTRSMLFDNRDATGKTMFAGSVAGGIWKSTTGGLTWSKAGCPDGNLAISCMLQIADGTIYAGTGEIFLISNEYQISRYEGFIGAGLLKSTDGENFTLIASTIPNINEGGQADWAYINELAVDPDNGRLYAATNTGLKYSNDGGNTWAYANTAAGAMLDTISKDVKIAENGMVVASVRNWCFISADGNPDNFVSHSTRHHVTPDSIVNPDKLPMEDICRIEFDIATGNNDIIYAMAARTDVEATINDDEFGELEGIYKSSDKGESWRVIGPGGSVDFNVLGSFYVDDGANQYYYLGYHDNTIKVWPGQDDVVFVGGYNMYIGSEVDPNGYYQWSQQTTDVEGFFTYVHPGHHEYVFTESDTNSLYIASDGGIYKIGASGFSSLNKTYNVDQFYSVAYTNKGKVVGGTQGNGVLFIDGYGTSEMTAIKLLNGNGGYSEVSMIKPECFIISGEKVNIRRSDDEGANFSPVFLINDIANPNGFITPFALWECFDNENSRDSVTYHAEQNYNANDTITAQSANADYPFIHVLNAPLNTGDSLRVNDPVSSRFFIAVEDVVWMTKQVLDFTIEPEWFEISEVDGMPQCIAYSNDVNYVFVGTKDGKLYRIANIALAYDYDRADINSPSCIISTKLIAEFEGRVITSIAVNPNNDNHIVVTLGNYGNDNYVYRTVNALAFEPSFESIQGDLAKMPVYASLFEFHGSNRIILGTENGIWSTTNPGAAAQWSVENDGIDYTPVFMLRQQRLSLWPISNYGTIYAATHGRGIFKSESFVGINDNLVSDPVMKSKISLYPNPASTSATVKFELNKSAQVLINIYDLSSRIVKHIELQQLNTGIHEIPISVEGLNRGTYLLQIISGQETSSTKFIIAN